MVVRWSSGNMAFKYFVSHVRGLSLFLFLVLPYHRHSLAADKKQLLLDLPADNLF